MSSSRISQHIAHSFMYLHDHCHESSCPINKQIQPRCRCTVCSPHGKVVAYACDDLVIGRVTISI